MRVVRLVLGAISSLPIVAFRLNRMYRVINALTRQYPVSKVCLPPECRGVTTLLQPF